MTELRLPAELQQRLQQEAEALNLPVADFLQMLLNSHRLASQYAQPDISTDFAELIQQAEQAHAYLLTLEELRA